MTTKVAGKNCLEKRLRTNETIIGASVRGLIQMPCDQNSFTCFLNLLINLQNLQTYFRL